jgi:carboxyl-terminal processing protease
MGQSLPDSNLVNRYFYTAKVWGYLKYFHSEVAKTSSSWDDVLTEALAKIRLSANEGDLNNALTDMLNSAGAMAIPNTPPPVVADSLKYNLDLRWLNDPILSPDVRSALDTVRTRFRTQSNNYVGVAAAGNPTFDGDKQYFSRGYRATADHWLLSLFRYWNIINYFAPNKFLIDRNWDDVLKEFIPKLLNCREDLEYQKTMMELIPLINDTHGFVTSTVIYGIVGDYYVPLKLKYIGEETVVMKTLGEIPDVKQGDIIRKVNGLDIHSVRDSLRRYTEGSNQASVERNINTRIVGGPMYTVTKLEVEGPGGRKEVSLSRSLSYASYLAALLQTSPVWRKVRSPDSLSLFGYVDLARLVQGDVPQMFVDLWNTDAIIFDIRNYPSGAAISQVYRYLFPGPLFNARFTRPDVQFPGTLSWKSNTFNITSAGTMYQKEIRILFDEETQSAAEYDVMILEQHRPSLKIGGQTAGADGNISLIYLPGNVQTAFTGLGVFYPDGRPAQRIGIVPDVAVLPTIDGIRQGRDEVLEEALRRKPQSLVSVERSTISVERPTFFQNYPNPFNGSTRLLYSISRPGIVRLKVYDLLGREVRTLVAGYQLSGTYSINLDIPDWPSGIYFASFEVDGKSFELKKMVCVR